jgi:Replicative DNA helicase
MSMVAPVEGSVRTLPNDLNAEKATLGGMLLSQEAVAEVLKR